MSRTIHKPQSRPDKSWTRPIVDAVKRLIGPFQAPQKPSRSEMEFEDAHGNQTEPVKMVQSARNKQKAIVISDSEDHASAQNNHDLRNRTRAMRNQLVQANDNRYSVLGLTPNTKKGKGKQTTNAGSPFAPGRDTMKPSGSMPLVDGTKVPAHSTRASNRNRPHDSSSFADNQPFRGFSPPSPPSNRPSHPDPVIHSRRPLERSTHATRGHAPQYGGPSRSPSRPEPPAGPYLYQMGRPLRVAPAQTPAQSSSYGMRASSDGLQAATRTPRSANVPLSDNDDGQDVVALDSLERVTRSKRPDARHPEVHHEAGPSISKAKELDEAEAEIRDIQQNDLRRKTKSRHVPSYDVDGVNRESRSRSRDLGFEGFLDEETSSPRDYDNTSLVASRYRNSESRTNHNATKRGSPVKRDKPIAVGGLRVRPTGSRSVSPTKSGHRKKPISDFFDISNSSGGEIEDIQPPDGLFKSERPAPEGTIEVFTSDDDEEREDVERVSPQRTQMQPGSSTNVRKLKRPMKDKDGITVITPAPAPTPGRRGQKGNPGATIPSSGLKALVLAEIRFAVLPDAYQELAASSINVQHDCFVLSGRGQTFARIEYGAILSAKMSAPQPYPYFQGEVSFVQTAGGSRLRRDLQDLAVDVDLTNVSKVSIVIVLKDQPSAADAMSMLYQRLQNRKSSQLETIHSSGVAALVTLHETTRKVREDLRPRAAKIQAAKAAEAARDRSKRSKRTDDDMEYNGEGSTRKGKGKQQKHEDPTQSKLGFASMANGQGAESSKQAEVGERAARRSRRAPNPTSYTEVDDDEPEIGNTIVPALSEREKLEFLFPWPLTGRADLSITRGDRHRIETLDFLNDTLLEFGLRNVLDSIPEVGKDKVYLFNSFFYDKLASKIAKPNPEDQHWPGYQSVRKWTKTANIFQKDYIIVPINENYHWYLAIIYNPQAILRERSLDEEISPEVGSPGTAGDDINLKVPSETGPGLSNEAEPSSNLPADQSRDELEGLYGDDDQDIEILPLNHGANAHRTIEYEDVDLDDFSSQRGDTGPVAGSVDGGLADDTERLSISGSDAGGAIVNASDLAMRAQSQRPPRSKSDAPAMDDTEGQTVESDRKDVKTKQQEPKEDMKIWGSDQCWIFTFDSLGGAHTPVHRNLERWLMYEAKDKRQIHHDRPSGAKYVEARVPQQPNFSDCGLFLVHYVESLLMNPESILTFIQEHPPMKYSEYRKPWEEKKSKVWRAEQTGALRSEWLHRIDTMTAMYTSQRPAEKAAVLNGPEDADGDEDFLIEEVDAKPPERRASSPPYGLSNDGRQHDSSTIPTDDVDDTEFNMISGAGSSSTKITDRQVENDEPEEQEEIENSADDEPVEEVETPSGGVWEHMADTASRHSPEYPGPPHDSNSDTNLDDIDPMLLSQRQPLPDVDPATTAVAETEKDRGPISGADIQLVDYPSSVAPGHESAPDRAVNSPCAVDDDGDQIMADQDQEDLDAATTTGTADTSAETTSVSERPSGSRQPADANVIDIDSSENGSERDPAESPFDSIGRFEVEQGSTGQIGANPHGTPRSSLGVSRPSDIVTPESQKQQFKAGDSNDTKFPPIKGLRTTQHVEEHPNEPLPQTGPPSVLEDDLCSVNEESVARSPQDPESSLLSAAPSSIAGPSHLRFSDEGHEAEVDSMGEKSRLQQGQAEAAGTAAGTQQQTAGTIIAERTNSAPQRTSREKPTKLMKRTTSAEAISEKPAKVPRKNKGSSMSGQLTLPFAPKNVGIDLARGTGQRNDNGKTKGKGKGKRVEDRSGKDAKEAIELDFSDTSDEREPRG